MLSSRLLRRWARMVRAAPRADLLQLRRKHSRAHALQAQLAQARHLSEARSPRQPAAPLPLPPHCDWAWRPAAWATPLAGAGLDSVPSGSGFGTELELFHDASRPAVTLRQLPQGGGAAGAGPGAPFALLVEVAELDGSYLSLALTLPEAAARGLKRRHVLTLHLWAGCSEDEGLGIKERGDGAGGTGVARVAPGTDPPIPPARGSGALAAMQEPAAAAGPAGATSTPRAAFPAFARLNIRHGPNLEQFTRPLPLASPTQVAFDLAGTRINEARVERLWLDLIFERPAQRRILLRDLTLDRRPRAEF